MSFYDIRKRFEIMQLLPFAHVLQILQYLFKIQWPKGKTMIYKTLHNKPANRATRTSLKTGVNSGSLERSAVQFSLVYGMIYKALF
jgi:hypothetical protein